MQFRGPVLDILLSQVLSWDPVLENHKQDSVDNGLNEQIPKPLGATSLFTVAHQDRIWISNWRSATVLCTTVIMLQIHGAIYQHTNKKILTITLICIKQTFSKLQTFSNAIIQHLQLSTFCSTQIKIKSCPVASTLPTGSTGVCGSASLRDGAIVTDHSSEWKSGSTQQAHCTVRALGHWEDKDT